MTETRIGDRAPTFSLPAHTGEVVSRADFRDRSVVVLYFYSKDKTPICTREACGFRDAYEDFVRAGAVVVGVSPDSAASHQAFAAARRFPFLLLSDADGSLRRAYGVPKTLGIMPGRVTYVIDRDGVIRLVFNSQLGADRHVSEALSVVRQLTRS
jgi:thioredoxin-dependent peroxiredoxin